MQEVSKRFPHGLPLLDPVKDMHIGEEEFKKIVRVRGHFVSLSISACVCLSVGLLSRGLSLSVCLSVVMRVLNFSFVCLSLCLSTYLTVSLSVCLPVCLSVCLSACLSVCLSVCLPVCLSACLSVCLPVSLSVYPPILLCSYPSESGGARSSSDGQSSPQEP